MAYDYLCIYKYSTKLWDIRTTQGDANGFCSLRTKTYHLYWGMFPHKSKFRNFYIKREGSCFEVLHLFNRGERLIIFRCHIQRLYQIIRRDREINLVAHQIGGM